jgi:transglutaminase-like putative cysteine protease
MVSSSRLAAILCFVIALAGVLPIFAWLENFPRLVLVAGLIIGILQEFKGRWYLKNWQFNLTLVPVFIWYALQYSNRNPIQPVVSVLVIMLAARLCGEKSIRNLMQINLLALFCLASRSLFELNPLFLLWLALLLLLVPVSLVVLTFYAQDSAMRFTRKEVNRVVLTALLITLLTVPAMALLFPILPRTALPLWTFLNPTVSGLTGMSDKVEPGTVSSVAETRVLVFRAEMAQQSTPPYWRGTVFNTIHGSSWTRTATVPSETSVPAGRPVIQTIYPEPSSSKILIGFDAPAEIRLPSVRMSPDLVFDYQRGLGRRVGYVVRSGADGLLRTSKTINRSFYLKVPEGTSPLIRQLAEGIKKTGTTDQKRLELVEQHFLNGGYRYSREGLPTGRDAIHQFLFVSKQGHCEFFASSCALLLRASGVPARLVGGYLGGEYNEVGGYYLVSQEMAHVWVEAYIAGKGWVRIDPSRFATNAGAVWNIRQKRTLAARLRLLVDALDYRWNRSIVTYDFESQVSQLRSAGSRLQALEQMIKARWKGLLIAFSGVTVLLILFKLRLHWFRYSQEERLLRRFRQVLKKRFGAELAMENKGLFELAAATKDVQVQQFAAIYAAAVYQDKPLGQNEIKQLRKLLDELSASHDTAVISR